MWGICLGDSRPGFKNNQEWGLEWYSAMHFRYILIFILFIFISSFFMASTLARMTRISVKLKNRAQSLLDSQNVFHVSLVELPFYFWPMYTGIFVLPYLHRSHSDHAKPSRTLASSSQSVRTGKLEIAAHLLF